MISSRLYGEKQGKISAQLHTTLCIQLLDSENNDKNNTLPLGKQICFTIAWGCAEILPKTVKSPAKQFKELFSLCSNRRFRGLNMFVFNFGVGSLEHGVKLGRFVIFDFPGNSLV